MNLCWKVVSGWLRSRKLEIGYESHFDGVIDDDEFLLSCDANTSKNPVFPYDNYRRFSLDNMDP